MAGSSSFPSTVLGPRAACRPRRQPAVRGGPGPENTRARALGPLPSTLAGLVGRPSADSALTNYTLKKDILFPLYQSKTQKERIVLNCTEGTLHCVREVKRKHTNSRATNATAACFSFSSVCSLGNDAPPESCLSAHCKSAALRY